MTIKESYFQVSAYVNVMRWLSASLILISLSRQAVSLGLFQLRILMIVVMIMWKYVKAVMVGGFWVDIVALQFLHWPKQLEICGLGLSQIIRMLQAVFQRRILCVSSLLRDYRDH